jgi:hypothetical protein
MLILFLTNTEDLRNLLPILVSIMSLFNSTVLNHEEMSGSVDSTPFVATATFWVQSNPVINKLGYKSIETTLLPTHKKTSFAASYSVCWD